MLRDNTAFYNNSLLSFMPVARYISYYQIVRCFAFKNLWHKSTYMKNKIYRVNNYGTRNKINHVINIITYLISIKRGNFKVLSTLITL